jgi:hypothetical protein
MASYDVASNISRDSDGEEHQPGHHWHSRTRRAISDQALAAGVHWAAGGANAEMLLLLLKHGGYVHEEDGNGATPLHWAAAKGRTDNIDPLLRKGGPLARPTFRDCLLVLHVYTLAASSSLLLGLATLLLTGPGITQHIRVSTPLDTGASPLSPNACSTRYQALEGGDGSGMGVH